MTSEFVKQRRKAMRLGMKKLARQEERRQAKEEEEISRRPYNSFELVEITRRKAKDNDKYDIETMFSQ